MLRPTLHFDSFLHFDDANRFCGFDCSRFRVTFGFFACSAAGSARVGALFLGRWIIPFARFAENNAWWGILWHAYGLGSEAFASVDAPTVAAMRGEGNLPGRADLVGNAVHDAHVGVVDRHATEVAATAFRLGFFDSLALFARRRFDRGTLPFLTLQLEASTLRGFVDHHFARITFRHQRFLA